MKYRIMFCTIKDYIGLKAKSDLFILTIKSKKFDITNRIHLGNGKWRIWCNEIVFDILQEI